MAHTLFISFTFMSLFAELMIHGSHPLANSDHKYSYSNHRNNSYMVLHTDPGNIAIQNPKSSMSTTLRNAHRSFRCPRHSLHAVCAKGSQGTSQRHGRAATRSETRAPKALAQPAPQRRRRLLPEPWKPNSRMPPALCPSCHFLCPRLRPCEQYTYLHCLAKTATGPMSPQMPTRPLDGTDMQAMTFTVANFRCSNLGGQQH